MVARVTSNHKVVGSSPTGSAFCPAPSSQLTFLDAMLISSRRLLRVAEGLAFDGVGRRDPSYHISPYQAAIVGLSLHPLRLVYVQIDTLHMGYFANCVGMWPSFPGICPIRDVPASALQVHPLHADPLCAAAARPPRAAACSPGLDWTGSSLVSGGTWGGFKSDPNKHKHQHLCDSRSVHEHEPVRTFFFSYFFSSFPLFALHSALPAPPATRNSLSHLASAAAGAAPRSAAMSTQQQAIILETILAIRRTLKRKADG